MEFETNLYRVQHRYSGETMVTQSAGHQNSALNPEVRALVLLLLSWGSDSIGAKSRDGQDG
jgi:hypothetical protein